MKVSRAKIVVNVYQNIAATNVSVMNVIMAQTVKVVRDLLSLFYLFHVS